MVWDGQDRRKESVEHSLQLAVLTTDVGYIKTAVTRIETMVEQKYVTKTEFEPVKRIVYGIVALILIAVIGALLTLVVRK